MSNIGKGSRRTGQARVQLLIYNRTVRREYFCLLGLATILMVLTSGKIFAQLQEGEKVVTVTNALWVRIRSTPDLNTNTILTRAAGGAQLRYLGIQGEWFHVELENGTSGWLHKEFGRLDSARDGLEVSVSIARIRETPASDSPVIGRAVQGLLLEILEKEEPWYRVRLPLGEEGWIRDDLVTLRAVKPSPEQLSGDESNYQENEMESTGADVQEMTPLPLSAAASSGEEGSASLSPTVPGLQDRDKPQFLMIFVSVFIGLSAFAVILMVAVVAARRRTSERSPEPDQPESLGSPHDNRSRTEYSDPLLKWMGKTPPKLPSNEVDEAPPAKTESMESEARLQSRDEYPQEPQIEDSEPSVVSSEPSEPEELDQDWLRQESDDLEDTSSLAWMDELPDEPSSVETDEAPPAETESMESEARLQSHDEYPQEPQIEDSEPLVVSSEPSEPEELDQDWLRQESDDREPLRSRKETAPAAKATTEEPGLTSSEAVTSTDVESETSKNSGLGKDKPRLSRSRKRRKGKRRRRR
jgi:uncharacterized protein YgiM (DUF1202 family)